MSKKDQSNNSGLITIEDDVVINREGDLFHAIGKCFLIPIDRVQRNSFTGAFAQAKSKTESKPKDSLLVIEEAPIEVTDERKDAFLASALLRGHSRSYIHHEPSSIPVRCKVDPFANRRALLNATSGKNIAFLCVEEDHSNSDDDDLPY